MQTALNPIRRYRNDIISWRAIDLGLKNYQDVVRWVVQIEGGKMNSSTIKRVFLGDNAGFDTVWTITDALGLKREALTDFNLKERQFRQAVLNGKRG